MNTLFAEATFGGREFEWPEEIVCLLERGPAGEDLVDEIFGADDALVSEGALYNRIIGESNASFVDFTEPTLVDELTHSLEVGVSVCHKGVYFLQHVHCGFVHFDEDTRVDLSETEELQDLLGLGGDAVETADTDDEDHLGLGFHEETVLGFGSTTKTDEISLLQKMNEL